MIRRAQEARGREARDGLSMERKKRSFEKEAASDKEKSGIHFRSLFSLHFAGARSSALRATPLFRIRLKARPWRALRLSDAPEPLFRRERPKNRRFRFRLSRFSASC